MSDDLQGVDPDRLDELHAAAEAAKTADDDQGAPDTAESLAQRRLREERERAVGTAKWDARIKESAAKRRGMPPAPSSPDTPPVPVYATAADIPALVDAARVLGDSGEPIPPEVRINESLLDHDVLTFGPARTITVDGKEFYDPECPAYKAMRRMDTAGGRAAVLARAILDGAPVLRADVQQLVEFAATKDARDARVRTAGDLTRQPVVVEELMRRPWTPDVELAAVEVDGEALATRTPLPTFEWVHHDGSPLFADGVTDDGGQLRLGALGETMNPREQYQRNAPLLLVARRQMGRYDYRGSLWADLRIAWVVLFGTVGGPYRWEDWDGAALLARKKDGGFRYPSVTDVKRWRALWNFVHGCQLPYRDRYGLDWIPLGRVEPLGNASRIIGPPEWYRQAPEALKRYTLTNTAAPERWSGDIKSAVRETVFTVEHRVYTAHDGRAAFMLEPVRKGGPGPWSEWYTWDRVLSELAGQTLSKKANTSRARVRRLVESLREAGYCHGRGHNGDVVEFDVKPASGRRGVEVRFRAAPQFIEAGRLAKAKEWRSVRLADWFGLRRRWSPAQARNPPDYV